MLYAGPFHASGRTILIMEKTRLNEFDSFWLGSRGPVKRESFYRTDSRTTHAPLFNGTEYMFNLSQNQRVVTFTRHSVIDVVTTVPVFLYGVLRLLGFLSVSCSVLNFKINAIIQMYTVWRRKNKNKKKNSRMSLTTSQYLRLLC